MLRRSAFVVTLLFAAIVVSANAYGKAKKLSSAPDRPASCENLPLSFSTVNHLFLSRERIRRGLVKADLNDGHLLIRIDLPSGCEFKDSLHVNLVPTSSDLGVTRNPPPGSFPCKAPASGDWAKAHCPIELFSLPDCCADKFRLFVHTVVKCDDGLLESAFAGPQLCTTKRWCNFEDVDVSVNCPLCQQCSTSAAACVDAPTDDRCMGRECSSTKLVVQRVCDGGQCVTMPDETCLTCNECDETSDTTAECSPVSTDDMCGGRLCSSDKIIGRRMCDMGQCVTTDDETCLTCNECEETSDSTAVCRAVDTDSMCEGRECSGDQVIGTRMCREGSCITQNDETCDTCNRCVETSTIAAECQAAATDDMCGGRVCISEKVVGARACDNGACVTSNVETCETCNECSQISDTMAECSAVDSDMMCIGQSCDGGDVVMAACMGGRCTTTLDHECSTCTQCVANSGTNTASCGDFDMDPRCSGQHCRGTGAGFITEMQCSSGSCVENTIETCTECNVCTETSSDTAACLFDSGSAARDVCSTCGEQCEQSAGGGTGACTQQCTADQTCELGDTDAEDVCSTPSQPCSNDNQCDTSVGELCVGGTCVVPDTCTRDGDCDVGEDCITGLCIASGDCASVKDALCDTVFNLLSMGGMNERAKCCPDTSGCVDNNLDLDANSVCSTNCGSCDPEMDTGGNSGVREVFCLFGTSTSAVVDAISPPLPRCQEVAASPLA